MTKTTQSRYAVGSDNQTPETVRQEVLNDDANFLATQFAKLASAPYDRVFWTNGKRIQVIIREVREEHEGKQGVAAG